MEIENEFLEELKSLTNNLRKEGLSTTASRVESVLQRFGKLPPKERVIIVRTNTALTDNEFKNFVDDVEYELTDLDGDNVKVIQVHEIEPGLV